jgi:hypothetical protein
MIELPYYVSCSNRLHTVLSTAVLPFLRCTLNNFLYLRAVAPLSFFRVRVGIKGVSTTPAQVVITHLYTENFFPTSVPKSCDSTYLGHKFRISDSSSTLNARNCPYPSPNFCQIHNQLSCLLKSPLKPAPPTHPRALGEGGTNLVTEVRRTLLEEGPIAPAGTPTK